jgi:ribosomal protein L6P/L9E
MSRVGLSKIKIPDGVTVTFIDGELTAKGKNGELSIKTHNFISIDINKDEVSFKTKKYLKIWKIYMGNYKSQCCKCY